MLERQVKRSANSSGCLSAPALVHICLKLLAWNTSSAMLQLLHLALFGNLGSNKQHCSSQPSKQRQNVYAVPSVSQKTEAYSQVYR